MNYNATWEPSSGSRGRRPYRAALRTGGGVPNLPPGFAYVVNNGVFATNNGAYAVVRTA